MKSKIDDVIAKRLRRVGFATYIVFLSLILIYRWLPFFIMNLALILWMPFIANPGKLLLPEKAQLIEYLLLFVWESEDVSASPIIQLGNLYEKEGKIDQAILTWKQSSQLSTANLLSQGRVFFNGHDYISAKRYYRLALDVMPELGDAYCELARIQILEGSEELALLAYYDAVNSNNFSNSHAARCNYELGMLLMEQGQWTEASQNLGKAANKVVPSYFAADVYTNYGIALYKSSGNVDLLQEQWKFAVNLGLNDIWLLVRYGQFGAQNGELSIVDYWKDEIAQQWPESGWPDILIGEYYFRQEDFSLATQSFERGVLKEPENAQGHYWLARSYLVQEQNKLALEQALLATELDPSSRLNYLLLGDTYLYLDQTDKATIAYQKMLDINHEDDVALGRLKNLQEK